MSKTAFDAQRGTLFLFDPDDLCIITDKKDPGYDPRVELPVNEGLVANILYRSQGVLEPVIVTKDGDHAVVVDGRQRVRAAREANRRLAEQGVPPLRVPCVLRRGDDGDLFSIMVSANEHRAEEPFASKAEKVQRFLNLGHTVEEAATLWGVSVSSINNWVAVLSLDKTVRRAVDEGQLSPSAAVPLAKLPKAEQPKALAKLLEGVGTRRPSYKDASRAAAGKKPKAPKPRVRTYSEVQQVLKAVGKRSVHLPVLRWFLGDDDDVSWMEG